MAYKTLKDGQTCPPQLGPKRQRCLQRRHHGLFPAGGGRWRAHDMERLAHVQGGGRCGKRGEITAVSVPVECRIFANYLEEQRMRADALLAGHQVRHPVRRDLYTKQAAAKHAGTWKACPHARCNAYHATLILPCSMKSWGLGREEELAELQLKMLGLVSDRTSCTLRERNRHEAHARGLA